MSVRFLTLSLAGLLLFGGGLTRSLAQAPAEKKTACRTAKQKLERRVYPVADLILPIDAPVSPEPARSESTVPCSGPSCAPTPVPRSSGCGVSRVATSRTLEDRLIKLIEDTVAPRTWQEQGGPARIEYFPIGMALVVHQTPAVQKQIGELLTALRHTQDMDVAVEVRLITVPDGFLETIAPAFIKKSDPVPQPVCTGCCPLGVTISCGQGVVAPGFNFTKAPGSAPLAFLNDAQLIQFMEALQGDRRTNCMQAPKVTVANGQCATVKVTEQQFYVTRVNVIQTGGQVVFCPVNEAFPTGVKLTVQPAISPDRRYVRLAVKADLTSLESAEVPLFPVTSFARARAEGDMPEQQLPFTQFVQQPRFSTSAVGATVCVPDGGTVLLGGLKKVREERCEFGPPDLSKIPYLSRLFKNVGYGRQTEQLLVLVTPRIIVNEQEETRKPTPAKPKSDVTCPYLKGQQAKPSAPVIPAAQPATVMENLEKLEQAQKIYQEAEYYSRHGQTDSAKRCYARVRELCPGSRYDGMATERLCEMQACQAPKFLESEAEEQQEPVATPCTTQVQNDQEVAKLLRRYHQACAAGSNAEAVQAAIQALAIDPTCFNNCHKQTGPGCGLRQTAVEWQRVWRTEQPSHRMPEPVNSVNTPFRAHINPINGTGPASFQVLGFDGVERIGIDFDWDWSWLKGPSCQVVPHGFSGVCNGFYGN